MQRIAPKPNAKSPAAGGLDPGDGPAKEAPAPSRKNVTRACSNCRKRRAKCDGREPCSSCQALTIPCLYTGKDKRARVPDLEARLEELTTRNEHLERFLADRGYSLPPSPQDTRASSSAPAEPSYPTVSPPSLSSASMVSPAAVNSPEPSPGLASPPTSTVSIYDNTSRPPMSLVGSAMSSCLAMTKDMFYTMHPPDLWPIVEAAFNLEIMDPATLCEICAFGVAGLNFLDDDITRSRIQPILLRTALINLDPLIEVDTERALRAFLCLSVHCVTNCRSGSTSFVAQGIQLVKTGRADVFGEEAHHIRRRKLARSLQFFENWLGTVHGYAADQAVTKLEADQPTDLAHLSYTNSEIMQDRMYSISRLAVSLLIELDQDQDPSLTIEHFSKSLETWFAAIPREMQLSSLLEADEDDRPLDYQKLLPLHILYLGTLLLLYRAALFKSADADPTRVWMFNTDSAHAPNYFGRSIMAAFQTIRLLQLLTVDKFAPFVTRSWLMSFQSFMAGSTLLFHCALQLVQTRECTAAWREAFAKAKLCVNILRRCTERNWIAGRLYRRMVPLHATMRSFEDGSQDLSAPVSSQTIAILHAAVTDALDILRLPLRQVALSQTATLGSLGEAARHH